MTDYKATPEQWAQIEAWMAIESEYSACVLELRARIEALEAGQRPASKVYEISKPLKLTEKQQQELNALLRPATSRPSPNSSQTRSSLVQRVHSCIVGEPECGHMQARAAIREVAAWMTSNPHVYFPPALVFAIEQEAEQ
jgi:Spy/CpxP family protein refolding chaperone